MAMHDPPVLIGYDMVFPGNRVVVKAAGPGSANHVNILPGDRGTYLETWHYVLSGSRAAARAHLVEFDKDIRKAPVKIVCSSPDGRRSFVESAAHAWLKEDLYELEAEGMGHVMSI